MLAVVDGIAVPCEATCAATALGRCLEQGDLKRLTRCRVGRMRVTVLGKRGGAGQSGPATAYDGNTHQEGIMPIDVRQASHSLRAGATEIR